MKRILLTGLLCLAFAATAMAGARTVVTGVTSYDPEKSWNGFTILAGNNFAMLVDMNGNLVHEWDLQGGSGFPNKIYPGGHLLTTIYPAHRQAGQGYNTVALLDFDGNIVREFNKLDYTQNPSPAMPVDENGGAWISRQHHDFQIAGNPVGYFVPDMEADLANGNMLILAHHNSVHPEITDVIKLQDDRIIIVDKDSNIIFDWKAADHFAEFENLSTNQNVRQALANPAESALPPADFEFNGFDWFHINCASWLGPNRHYDAGDQRFHPENIIADSRETSHLFIIDHVTGEIVWQIAPPFDGENSDIGEIIGVHHTHMIPQGLPGAGNIMIFDNGGVSALYPEIANRFYSRVVEFDPVSKEKVWEYSHVTAGQRSWELFGDKFFFSAHISDAQRLPNGNTLICEGSKSRIIEVTPDYEIVWEYLSPYSLFSEVGIVYRAYRVPYEWVPQLSKGSEVPVTRLLSSQIQIPNDNGVYPNITPKLDASTSNLMGEPVR